MAFPLFDCGGIFCALVTTRFHSLQFFRGTISFLLPYFFLSFFSCQSANGITDHEIGEKASCTTTLFNFSPLPSFPKREREEERKCRHRTFVSLPLSLPNAAIFTIMLCKARTVLAEKSISHTCKKPLPMHVLSLILRPWTLMKT